MGARRRRYMRQNAGPENSGSAMAATPTPAKPNGADRGRVKLVRFYLNGRLVALDDKRVPIQALTCAGPEHRSREMLPRIRRELAPDA